MASAFAGSAKAYMDSSGADGIIQDMMAAVVLHQPDEPVDFLIDWLVRVCPAARPSSAARVPHNDTFAPDQREEKTAFPESGEGAGAETEPAPAAKDSPAS